ncbi:MAG: acetolactate synthase small subunit [Oscillospiraceae bacterium]|nr:acetolactate synthase small subunit [Oscillospiraceae bacterium]
MKRTISVLVENKAGVLSRVSGLFARRGFNINSLAVGETEDPAISRMTIVSDGDDHTIEQVEKQLNKMIDTLKIKLLEDSTSTRRELILVKVGAGLHQRGEVIDIARVFDAKIVDISPTTLTVEHSDRPERIDLLVDLLTPYKIKEVARTGTVALEKGAGTIGYKPKKD